jgi:hypothetical protein
LNRTAAQFINQSLNFFAEVSNIDQRRIFKGLQATRSPPIAVSIGD